MSFKSSRSRRLGKAPDQSSAALALLFGGIHPRVLSQAIQGHEVGSEFEIDGSPGGAKGLSPFSGTRYAGWRESATQKLTRTRFGPMQ